jgi:cellulose synthase/poly-beta-1,6-N-acetylglucosamine synthase-like glycosyltransferase
VRVAFDPHPLGWTQAPEDWRSLRAQRHRWRRGRLQSLWRHRAVIGRVRFGTVGPGALPFMLVFEGLGPVLETAGYVVTAVAAVLGLLNWESFRMVVVTSVMFGAAVTLIAVLLSDVVTRRYTTGRDLVTLVGVVILESCGCRQLTLWWGCVGTVQALSGKGGWGPMKRRAFKA